jgi:hypothetical protein
MITRLILALLALLTPITAQAHELEGRWALRIDEATIFVFELDQTEGGEWRGQWTRPETFASNGAVFTRLAGSKAFPSTAGAATADGAQLSFDDPAPGAVPDIFRFRHLGPGRAQMIYVGTEFMPFPLIAVVARVGLGPFEPGRVYDLDNAVTDPAKAPLPPPTPAAAAIQPPAPATEPEAEGLGADFLDGL